ncbi:MAG: metal-dependent transcriptional regulator [Treponema sp.]|jgi:Mn-dependent DtxR family transcriptional regulator|nr:metal-dependent transcriptional regulator [Treponema sp.]
MNDIHESGEDYLEAILCLKEENGIARSVDVARRLNVSKPSVSRAMSILEEKGYVFVGKIGSLELTEEGKKLADEIYARHVLLTRFLQKITGVSEEQAEANACKIEHDIDDDVKRGIEKWMKENS